MSRNSKKAGHHDVVPLTMICSGSGLKEQIHFDLRKPLNELKEALVHSSKLGKFDVAELRLFYLGRELKNGGRSLESLGVGAFDVNVIHVHPSKLASATWKVPPVSSQRSAASAAAVAVPTGMARFMQPPTATGGMPVMAGFHAASFGPASFASLLRPSGVSTAVAGGPPPPPPPRQVTGRNNEVIEIGDDEDVQVTNGPPPAASLAASNLLESLRNAISNRQQQQQQQQQSQNTSNEVVNLDNDDDDDDDEEEDDDDDDDEVDQESDDDECIVVGTLPPPSAKRRRL